MKMPNPLNTKLLNTRRKRYAAAAIFIAVAGLVLFFAWMSSDNEGTISQSTSQKPAAVPAYKDFDGKFIAFRYKGLYTFRALPAKDGDLELYNFAASTMYQKDIAVSVSQLPAGNLTNNPAYNLRRSQPSVYAKKDVAVAGGAATLWVKHDGKEETAIIPRGDRVAVLSFTTQGPIGQLDSEVTALLQSFQWK